MGTVFLSASMTKTLQREFYPLAKAALHTLRWQAWQAQEHWISNQVLVAFDTPHLALPEAVPQERCWERESQPPPEKRWRLKVL